MVKLAGMVSDNIKTGLIDKLSGGIVKAMTKVVSDKMTPIEHYVKGRAHAETTSFEANERSLLAESHKRAGIVSTGSKPPLPPASNKRKAPNPNPKTTTTAAKKKKPATTRVSSARKGTTRKKKEGSKAAQKPKPKEQKKTEPVTQEEVCVTTPILLLVF